MSGFENWPAPILRRWLLSAAAGPVILLIGLAGRIALHDPTLLTLSSLLASCICDCLPSLFLSFLLFYRYFVNDALRAGLTKYL